MNLIQTSKTNTSKVADLYAKLDTRQKRIAMRLLRALSEGGQSDGELTKICRVINKGTHSSTGRKKSGYILFYTEQYQKIKNKNPELTLGQIAKEVGKKWGQLAPDEKAKYNKRAATAA